MPEAISAANKTTLLYFAVTAPEANRQPLVAAREVRLGQEQRGQVEILAGLRPGDRVRIRIRILSEL